MHKIIIRSRALKYEEMNPNWYETKEKMNSIPKGTHNKQWSMSIIMVQR